MKILLEICVDTIESAVAAIEGGADRIELCSALSEGGLTPTVGLLRAVKTFLIEWSKNTGCIVPVYCMVRCRRGSDFQYSQSEMDIMLWDVKLLKDNGADGFVFGALDESGKVHRSHALRTTLSGNEGRACFCHDATAGQPPSAIPREERTPASRGTSSLAKH
uniref:Copper homeostasis protein cutC homolog n=1 Tax=Anopheles atroparvus TaxID=41427 RepID=A0A182JI96_ANOAO